MAGPLSTEISDLKKDIKDYQPGSASNSPDRIDFPENLYIGLFGKTGCGKTSLINSIKYAANGGLRRNRWEQVAPQDKAGGQTMFRKLARIINHIFVIDNRGSDDPSTEDAIDELTAQLDGQRSYDQLVKWQGVDEGAYGNLDFENSDVGDCHPIGCAVFVFNALHDLDDNTTGLTEVIDSLHIHQGRYPVAVITHVDVEGADVEGLSAALRTTGVSDIFKVVNLTEGKPNLDEKSQLILLNLIDRCMVDGDETLVFKYYQRKGAQRRGAKEQARVAALEDRENELRRRIQADRQKRGICPIQ